MRTNVAGFALALGMGLMVVLMGLLVLSAAGLTSLTSPVAEVAGPPAPGPDSLLVPTATLEPVDAKALATAMHDPAIAAGDALFKNNCAQCHAIHEKVVGPALAGITKRRTIGWLVPWVQNSTKVVASGDEYAIKLFNDNGKQQMPSFPQLSEKDIRSIVAWVTVQEDFQVMPAPAQYVDATVAAR